MVTINVKSFLYWVVLQPMEKMIQIKNLASFVRKLSSYYLGDMKSYWTQYCLGFYSFCNARNHEQIDLLLSFTTTHRKASSFPLWLCTQQLNYTPDGCIATTLARNNKCAYVFEGIYLRSQFFLMLCDSHRFHLD